MVGGGWFLNSLLKLRQEEWSAAVSSWIGSGRSKRLPKFKSYRKVPLEHFTFTVFFRTFTK